MTSLPHEPDGRDVFDFADAVNAGKHPQPRNDLERTYLHVHRVMSAASPPIDLKQQTWESITTELGMSAEKPISNRTKRQLAPPPAAPTRRSPKRWQWTPMASIAAAVLVMLTSAGMWWRLTTTPVEHHDAPYAPNLALLAGGDSTPVATQIAENSYCADMTENIPVAVVDMDDLPQTTGSLDVVVWMDGTTVMARCTDGTQIVLAEGAEDVYASNYPQIVEYGFRDGSIYIRVYHNLMNGRTIADNWSLRTSLNTGEFGSSLANPLQVVISTQDQMQWSLANFDTMEESTLTDLAGLRIYSGQSITATSSEDGSTMAIAVSMYESEGSSTLLHVPGAPGDVVVISADFQQVYWLSIPEGMTQVNNISLSGDGSLLTFTWDPKWSQGEGKVQQITVDVATGEVVSDN